MKRESQSGSAYIDVMVAIVILMIGILALISAITSAVVQTKGQEQQLRAKHIATAAIESIISVKETDSVRLGWSRVGNVGSNPDVNNNPQGIFLTGFQPVRLDPGTDEVIGTADDTGAEVPGYTRRIVITDQCDPDRRSPNCNPPGRSAVRIRTVEVTVTYFVSNLSREERITTVLTNY